MKSIFKILVLGVVPILMATAVVDEGFAADKGSQLIFQTNMAHKNFISVANTNDDRAVTVLTQYYNDEMTEVIYYLRVIPGGGNLLIDPFDHEIPGTETNVSEVLGDLPAMTQTEDDKLPGVNSGRFLVVITAVGANMGVDHNEDGKIADAIVETSTVATTTVSVGGYRILDAVAADATAGTAAMPRRIQLIVKTVNTTTDPDTTTYADAGAGFSAEMNRAETVNVLFPDFLAEDMHGIDNIDNGGTLSLIGEGLGLTNKDETKTDPDDTGNPTDVSTKNVGKMTVSNAIPIAFNHLTGHFTEALSETASGGSDQTASWGGTPIVRPAVSNTANTMVSVTRVVGTSVDAVVNADADATNDEADDVVHMLGDYHVLDGKDSRGVYDVITSSGATLGRGWTSRDALIVADADATPPVTGDALAASDGTAATALAALPTNVDAAIRGLRGGRLAEKDAGGAEVANVVTKGATRSGYTAPSKITDGPVKNRGLSGGALVLPALHGGGAETQQIMLFLSVSDNFGGRHKLVPALTKYAVTVHDNMGNVLPNPADTRDFGSVGGPKLRGTSIIVEGMQVTTNAAACGGEAEDMIEGYWTLDNLISDIPTAASGAKDFAGLDAMLDPMKNATPGFIKFMRAALTCTKEYGDGNNDDDDGVPARDNRTYVGGTLIVEEKNTDRAFVTTGQALLKYLTPSATFGASWSLKSPASPPN